MNHLFDTKTSNVLPRVRMTSMGGKSANVLAIHEEVTNGLVFVDTTENSALKVKLATTNVFDSVADLTRQFSKGPKRPPAPFFRFAVRN